MFEITKSCGRQPGGNKSRYKLIHIDSWWQVVEFSQKHLFMSMIHDIFQQKWSFSSGSLASIILLHCWLVYNFPDYIMLVSRGDPENTCKLTKNKLYKSCQNMQSFLIGILCKSNWKWKKSTLIWYLEANSFTSPSKGRWVHFTSHFSSFFHKKTTSETSIATRQPKDCPKSVYHYLVRPSSC